MVAAVAVTLCCEPRSGGTGSPGVTRSCAVPWPYRRLHPADVVCAARCAAVRPGTGSCARSATPELVLRADRSGWATPTRPTSDADALVLFSRLRPVPGDVTAPCHVPGPSPEPDGCRSW